MLRTAGQKLYEIFHWPVHYLRINRYLSYIHVLASTSSGTGTLNYTGDLVDVTTGNETNTQAMLDNGITLDSTTIVQNCEWFGSSYQCGQAQSGRDTFKTTVKILDSDGEVLSQVDQIRNTDSGYYGNANKYTDQVIYNGIGSNQFDWTWIDLD